jgi:superfamily I DNA and/or RNA helicase
VSFLLYVDTIYVQEERHNLRTREKTQSTYKRKHTIYVQEKRHNLRTRGIVSFLVYVDCVFPLVRRLCLSSFTYIVSFLLYVDCVFPLVRRLCLFSCTQSTYKRKDTIYVQEERHNLRTREKTQSTYKRKDTIYVQEERHNIRKRGKTQSTYKRKDTIYVKEERHNLRTRGTADGKRRYSCSDVGRHRYINRIGEM